LVVRTRSSSAAIALSLVFLVVGCGSSAPVVAPETTASVAPTTESTAPAGPALRVGLVRGPGGPNARAFGNLAAAGLHRAADELGIEARTLRARSRSEAVASVDALAGQGFDLVFGVGGTAVGAIDAAAPTYPKVRFAIVDASVETLASRARNVVGLTFRDEQAGYLAGYLAGLVQNAETGSKNTIGWVGAESGPSIDRYAAGYIAGARAVDPTITILHGYSHTFTDPAKCKELALQHLSLGSDVEFEAAGRCGLGVLDSANERNIWGIASGVDESSFGPQILTSAVKHVDVAVLATIKSMQDKSLRPGVDTVFDTANGGVGLGAISRRVPESIVVKLRTEELRLASGIVPDIPTTIR
jgi:basic membrane protein A